MAMNIDTICDSLRRPVRWSDDGEELAESRRGATSIDDGCSEFISIVFASFLRFEFDLRLRLDLLADRVRLQLDMGGGVM